MRANGLEQFFCFNPGLLNSFLFILDLLVPTYLIQTNKLLKQFVNELNRNLLMIQ